MLDRIEESARGHRRRAARARVPHRRRSAGRRCSTWSTSCSSSTRWTPRRSAPASRPIDAPPSPPPPVWNRAAGIGRAAARRARLSGAGSRPCSSRRPRSWSPSGRPPTMTGVVLRALRSCPISSPWPRVPTGTTRSGRAVPAARHPARAPRPPPAAPRPPGAAAAACRRRAALGAAARAAAEALRPRLRPRRPWPAAVRAGTVAACRSRCRARCRAARSATTSTTA